ncbi:MAG: hypothetical protein WA830_05975 [Candidatus Sulfotelmatobacter sp.]
MTRFYVPGSTWSDFPVGTTFDVQVEKEHRQLFPKGQKPTVETGFEHWKLTQKKETDAVFQVSIGTASEEKTLPLAKDAPPAEGSVLGNRGMEIHAQIMREVLPTPFGDFYATRIHVRRFMNEAGGEDDEWRVAGYPIPLKSQNRWMHKEQEDSETRTVVRFEAATPGSK